ncbi:MAG: ABC transporter permease [Peptostreptococcus stomatis]|nr:ABC transporter permease [Peptostreptococcus stomatis]MBL6465861.1 ABC transporter permease [Peptostreptococcus stomatis]
MLKLIKNYLIKDYKKNISIILVLSLSLAIVFSNATAKLSQSEYAKNIMESNSPMSQLDFIKLSSKQIDVLKRDNNVEKVSVIKNYADVNLAKSYTSPLISYDKEYFESYNLKITKGRYPENKNEIIVPEKIFNSMKYNLNQNVTIKANKIIENREQEKEYYNFDLNAKVAGSYSYPEELKDYYKFKSIFIYDSSYSFDKYADYDGNIYLKDKKANLLRIADQLCEKIKSNSDHIYINDTLERVMEEKSNLSQEYDVFDIVFIAMAILLVFNILFLMHKSMSKEQGLLRIIGMKKKEVIMFELLKSLIVFFVATVLGLVFSIFLTKIFIRNFYFISTSIEPYTAPVIYDVSSLKKILLTLFIVTLISIIIPILDMYRFSPVEQYFETGEGKYKKIDLMRRLSFKDINKKLMAVQIGKQKTFMIISAVIISFSGYLFLQSYSHVNNEDKYTSPTIYSLGRYDLILNHNRIVDRYLNGYSKNDIEYINKLNNVRSIVSTSDSKAHLYLDSRMLSSEYNEQRLSASDGKIDVRIDLIGINKEGIQSYVDNEKILESGRLPNENSDIPEVLMYNKFYSKIKRGIFKLLPNQELNDELTISYQYYDKDSGIVKFKKSKVRVVGFISDNWDSITHTEHFVPDIITYDSIYRNLTNISNVNEIKVELSDKDSLENIYNKIESRFSSKNFYECDTEKTILERLNRYEKKNKIKREVSSAVLLSMSIVNIIAGIILTFNLNKRGYATMLSLGMSRRNLKRMLRKNGILSIIPGIVLAIIVSLIYNIKWFNQVKLIAGIQGIEFKETFSLPYMQIVIFILICTISILLALSVVYKNVDDIDIIECLNNKV